MLFLTLLHNIAQNSARTAIIVPSAVFERMTHTYYWCRLARFSFPIPFDFLWGTWVQMRLLWSYVRYWFDSFGIVLFRSVTILMGHGSTFIFFGASLVWMWGSCSVRICTFFRDGGIKTIRLECILWNHRLVILVDWGFFSLSLRGLWRDCSSISSLLPCHPMIFTGVYIFYIAFLCHFFVGFMQLCIIIC